MTSASPLSPGRAAYGLAILCVLNLLNYTDRYILAGVMPHITTDFNLTKASGGLLATVFTVVYMFASPLGGYLGDRMPRRLLISLAVFIWSAATVASALASTYQHLLWARAFTGIGEAGYGVVAPAFIADMFAKDRRTRMLAYFYTAMPLGAALGFVLGGFLVQHFTWHTAFYAGGLPGLALAVLALFLPEPERGAMDDAPLEKVPFSVGLAALATNARFWIASAGLTLMTFSVGGLSYWMPTFLTSERGYGDDQSGLFLGASTVVGGFVGTLLGGALGDRLDKRMAGGGVLLSGVGLLLAAPLMFGAVHATQQAALFVLLLLAQLFIFMQNGPLNAAIVNCVPPASRAFAVGINTLLLHLLGDAASPPIIGAISDASSLGHAIELNAIPVLLGGLVLLLGRKAFAMTGPAMAPSSPAA